MNFDYMSTWANNNYSLEQKLKLELRIACPEIGYPEHEARFSIVKDWEVWSGDSFNKRMKTLVAASAGAQ